MHPRISFPLLTILAISQPIVSAVAAESLAEQPVTAEQVAVVARIFSSEATKVEYAKFAYIHTIDKENYMKVASAFSSETDKKDLLSFMKSHL